MGTKHFLFIGIICLFVSFVPTQNLLAKEWIYTTSEGDTLWDFSKKYLHHVMYWPKIKKINNVKNPRRLQPNKRLRIPLEWVKVNPVSAKVIAVHGLVQVSNNKSTNQKVSVGLLVHLGDSLQTSADSNVSVKFADGSIVTIHENSHTVFDHLTAYGDSGMVDSRIRLNQGRIDSKVIPAVGSGSRFEIHTPSAISAVRGTKYRLSSDQENQLTNLEVLKGKVKIAAEQKSILVSQGFGSQVASGKAPIAARELIAAPELGDIPERIRQLNWPLTWESLNGAHQYRVEVSALEDFNTIAWNRVVTSNRVNLPDLADGEHFIRVRGIDDLNLEGINQTTKLNIDVRPQPPILLQPPQKQLLRGKGPKMRWSESFDAKSYILQVSNDESFSSIVHEQDNIEGISYDLRHLDTPQTYYWRLVSVAADGELGPYSLPRQYQVKAIPAQPSALLSSDSDQVTLSWQAGSEGQSHEVQLAEDPEFTKLLSHEVIKLAELVIPQEYSLVRYFRVRLVEDDGYHGAWSTIQKIDPLPDKDWLYLFLPTALLIFLL